MTHSLPTQSVTHHQPLVNATTRAIELALRPDGPDGDGPLREVLQVLCADARRLSIQPEELIILFKTKWRGHTELRSLHREEENAALDHVISMCIEEYYRDGLRT